VGGEGREKGGLKQGVREKRRMIMGGGGWEKEIGGKQKHAKNKCSEDRGIYRYIKKEGCMVTGEIRGEHEILVRLSSTRESAGQLSLHL